MDIGLLRPDTIPLTIAEFVIVVAMLEVDLGLKRPSTLPFAIMEFIILVTMIDMDLGFNRPTTIPLAIVDQDLLLTGEVYIGLRTDTLTPKTQVTVLDC